MELPRGDAEVSWPEHESRQIPSRTSSMDSEEALLPGTPLAEANAQTCILLDSSQTVEMESAVKEGEKEAEKLVTINDAEILVPEIASPVARDDFCSTELTRIYSKDGTGPSQETIVTSEVKIDDSDIDRDIELPDVVANEVQMFDEAFMAEKMLGSSKKHTILSSLEDLTNEDEGCSGVVGKTMPEAKAISTPDLGQEDQKHVDGFDTHIDPGVSLPGILPSDVAGFPSTSHSVLYETTRITTSPETNMENEVKREVDTTDRELEGSGGASVHDTSANEYSSAMNLKESFSFGHDMYLGDDGPSWNSVPRTDDMAGERVEFHGEFETFEMENLKNSGVDELQEAEQDKTDGLVDAPNADVASCTELSTEIISGIKMECTNSATCAVEQPINRVFDDGMKFSEFLNIHSSDKETQHEDLPCSSINDTLSSVAHLEVSPELRPEKMDSSPGRQVKDDESVSCAVGHQINMMVDDEVVLSESLNTHVNDEGSQPKEPLCSSINNSLSSIPDLGAVPCKTEKNIVAQFEMDPTEPSNAHDSDEGGHPEKLSCVRTISSGANLEVSQRIKPEKIEANPDKEVKHQESVTCVVEQPLDMVVDGGVKLSETLNPHDNDICVQPEEMHSASVCKELKLEESMNCVVQEPLMKISNSSHNRGSQSEELPCATRSNLADLCAIERARPEEIEISPRREVNAEEAVACAVDQPPNMVVDPGMELSTSSETHDSDIASQPEELPVHRIEAEIIEFIPDREVKSFFVGQQPNMVVYGEHMPSDGLSTHDNDTGALPENNNTLSSVVLEDAHRIEAEQIDNKENNVQCDNLVTDDNASNLNNYAGVNSLQKHELDKEWDLDDGIGRDANLDITNRPASDIGDTEQLGSSGTLHLEAESESDKDDGDVYKHPLQKIEVDEESTLNEEVELDANLGIGNTQVYEDERDMELSESKPSVEDLLDDADSELEPHEGVELDANVDTYISENERKKNFPESNPNDEDLQDDLGPSSEGVSTEKQQRRKRGRKAGKKLTHSEEKLTHESDILEHQQSRKRGRRLGTKAMQKEEEDVCFVCCDGGNLILCDKRSCPKAYHLECTGRQSDFFQRKGQWFCGWHVCAQCSKSATIHCFTCPRALCNNCLKEGNFHCITKNRGLCEGCYLMAYMIEHNETVNADGVQVDFNDQETYEGLFNEYWQDIKLKHSLTSADLDKSGKTKGGYDVLADGSVNDDPEEAMGDEECGSSDSEDKLPTTRQLRLMKRKRITRSSAVENVSTSELEEDEDNDESENMPKRSRIKALEFDGWASKELKELVQYMKEDPKKQLPLFGVKKLLWRYIDNNNLTNPRRRGQIICDERLQKIFGKKRVGRFEMMKLISLHVATPVKNAANKAWESQPGENDAAETYGGDENLLGKKKSRRKGDDKRLKPDPSEYAAVNVKNMNLIYLKRSILDELRNDPDLESKVVGAFVRIRVPSMVNKNDTCYRLVQVVGAKQIYDALDPEKVTDVILEILNLHKREEVTADLVSNQDFLEEECQRLRQSVRCGLIKTMTVGELEERARALREVKVKDWFENELLRLSHLRDRASEQGRKRDTLRECVEKLQLLSNPDEKQRQLHAPFDIDADPCMDPNFESDDEDLPPDDSPGETGGGYSMQEKVSATRTFDRGAGAGSTVKFQSHWDDGNFAELQDTQWKASGWSEKDSGHKDNVKQYMGMQSEARSLANEKNTFPAQGRANWGDSASGRDKTASWNSQGSAGRKEVRWGNNVERSHWGDDTSDILDADISINSLHGRMQQKSSTSVTSSIVSSVYTSGLPADASVASITNAITPVDSEKEKIWCYLDPTKTIQGPFTMEQLRKWEKTNLFPLDLRIWRVTESQDASIFLTDALTGNFSKKPPQERQSHTQWPNSFPSTPTDVLNRGPAQLVNTGGFSLGSSQGSAANGFPLGHMQGANAHSLNSAQGSSGHGFSPQMPAVHGYPPGPSQTQQMHGFSTGTQASNIHSFPPGPTQGSYVTYPQVPNQLPYMSNSPRGGPLQVPKNYPNVPMQPGQNVTGFPQNTYAPVPSAAVGHTQQRPRFNAPLNAPSTSNFPMSTNNAGFGSSNPVGDFRNSSLPVRAGQDQLPVPNQMDDGAWNHGRRSMNARGTQSPGFATDSKDGSSQRHFGGAPKFRGSDQYQGNDGRFASKKDLFCRFFAKGLCRKGQDCDFKHE